MTFLSFNLVKGEPRYERLEAIRVNFTLFLLALISHFPRILVVEAEFDKGVFFLCKYVSQGLKYRKSYWKCTFCLGLLIQWGIILRWGLPSLGFMVAKAFWFPVNLSWRTRGAHGVYDHLPSMDWKRIRHKVCAFSNRILFIFNFFPARFQIEPAHPCYLVVSTVKTNNWVIAVT